MVGQDLTFLCNNPTAILDWEWISWKDPNPNNEYDGAKKIAQQDGWIWKDE